MMRRFGVKSSLPALLPAGVRSFSKIATNFPFYRSDGEGVDSRSDNDIASSNGSFDKEEPGQIHDVITSLKQAFKFTDHKSPVVESRKSSAPTCVGDDDDFAELCPSLAQPADLGSDMVKENLKSTKSPGLSSRNKSQQSPNTQGQYISRRKTNTYPSTDSIPVNPNDVSRTKGETETQNLAAVVNRNNTSSLYISIDNVPPHISLQSLSAVVSNYGEISSATLRPGPDKTTSCHVKFKHMKSKERALAAQCITVMNCGLPVRNLQFSEYMTARISNISMETSEPTIHSMCMSHGDVAGLARTKEGTVEVLFKVKSEFAAENIVKRLNGVSYDDCKWSAHLVVKPGQNLRPDAADSHSIESKINNIFGTFRKNFQMQRIYLEDLEEMHYAVMHLRDRPTDSHPQVKG